MKQRMIPVISVVAGILAFVLSHGYLKRERDRIRALEEELYRDAARIRVVAAARDLPAGTVLSRDDLQGAEAFESSVGRQVATDADYQLLFGRKTLYTLRAGEPISWSYIEGGMRGEETLAAVVSHGMRAISLSVSGAAAVSGMVRPNDRVDVLGTFSFSSKTAPGEMETVTLTVLQDVTVLATGRQLAKQAVSERGYRSSAGYSTVTVEVTPREAELLVFAQKMKGSLTLSLRNPTDVSYESDLPEINFEHLETKLPELNLYRQRNIRHKRDL